EVTIGVYNMLGEHVAELASDIFSVGKHEVTFDANDLGQGTYFVRMTTDNFTATKNMNIVK
ncbi:MAG: T9SS C-terminal target domain-containing protein, partial [Flavobacteriales bacterium TMED191]